MPLTGLSAASPCRQLGPHGRISLSYQIGTCPDPANETLVHSCHIRIGMNDSEVVVVKSNIENHVLN